MDTIIVTGAAGFIGYHLSDRLLRDGWHVVGVDNLSDYYDVRLKRSRLDRLLRHDAFLFRQVDIRDRATLLDLFSLVRPRYVVNLAAQPGVRYSLENPFIYVDVNIVGFHNVLEACRHHQVEHLVYASSSSVYGANRALPYSTSHSTDHPVSLYAATKKANEVMAHSYSHLFQLRTTGLRLFTVYGPWGRPDMALFRFADAITKDKTLELFNTGMMARDFTYVDDVVEAMTRTLFTPGNGDDAWDPLHPNPATSAAPYRIYNVGNTAPVNLHDVVALLEKHLGRKARVQYLPMQAGDVEETFSDSSELSRDFGFRPCTPLDAGLKEFVAWYRAYYATESSAYAARL